VGKLIVIEGTDSSGKETQTNLLYERLKKEGKKVMKVSFPDYESNSSAPIKMYLAGEFGEDPSKVNSYASSMMYAIDRFASFKTKWETFYNEGGIIIADRYTTSNMVHQASKIDDGEKRDNFLDWLENLEFEKVAIPRPDEVIFLNMPLKYSKKLMKNRENKITGELEKDIHEKNVAYLKKSYDTACYCAKKYSWVEIVCNDGEEIKSISRISEEVYEKVMNTL